MPNREPFKQLHGSHDGRNTKVLADGEPLEPLTESDGFKWGSVDADAELLSAAILIRFTNMSEALELRMRFLREVILMQAWPNDLQLLGVHVEEWIERQRKAAGKALVGAGV